MNDIETEALRIMLAATQEKLAAAKELLMSCAPLTWAMTNDYDAAHEWEIRAYRFLGHDNEEENQGRSDNQ